jgi:hypothetical protein
MVTRFRQGMNHEVLFTTIKTTESVQCFVREDDWQDTFAFFLMLRFENF